MSVTFSANLGFLWKELPFLERIAAARAAGFPAVEFHDQAQEMPREALREALAGLSVIGLNVRHRDTNGLAALSGREGEAADDIAEAVALALDIGACAVHVLSGRTAGAGGAQRLAERLTEAADAAPALTILIEPICPQSIPGYFLTTLEQAADVLSMVDRPNAKILFDCFHVQRAGGDILARFRTYQDIVGHVQIAGGLTRAEPDFGEINYAWLIPALQDAGYEGAFGAEYVPRASVEEGLGWREAFDWERGPG